MTAPAPMEPDRYHCDCGRALPCRHCPDPEREPVRKRCGAMQPTPTAMTDYITCYCSRPVGHDGEHRSWLVNGQVIGFWPADPTPDPERLPARIDALFPDVIDLLTETTATRRVADRHTNDKENDHDHA